MAFDGRVTSLIAQGLAADRPVTPNIDPDTISFWFSTDTDELSVYADSAWHEDVLGVGVGDMLSANNLSDVASASTSLTNLGISSFAKTILDDADAAAVRATIGVGTGTGTVTTTGSPASGNLAKFSGASSIVNGDLSGDVTTSGTLAATIANGAVSLAKMANMATASVIYRKTAGSGAPEVNTLATLKTDLALAKADVGLGNVDNTSDANKRPSFATPSASFSAADSDNNSHKTFSGSSQTLTLPGGLTAGTAFTGRFTTAWSLAISSSGTISKNGASPSGVTTGSVAANSVLTFLYEGSNVWIVTGSGLT